MHEYIFMDNRQIHSQRDRQTDKMGTGQTDEWTYRATRGGQIRKIIENYTIAGEVNQCIVPEIVLFSIYFLCFFLFWPLFIF